jgi:glutamate synthase (NADPH/NADH)
MGLNLEELYGKDLSEEQAPHEYSQYQPKKGYGWANALPERQGLYDPEYEKDACGVGFAA